MLHLLFVLAVIVIGIALLPTAVLWVAVMASLLIEASWDYPLFGLVVFLVAGAIAVYKCPRLYVAAQAAVARARRTVHRGGSHEPHA